MHRAKGDRLVRARVLPVCDNGVENITHATAHAPEKTLQRKLQYFFSVAMYLVIEKYVQTSRTKKTY